MNPLLIQLIGGMLGETSSQQNPAFGATEPGDVNPDYTGDPSEAINKFGTTKPYQDPDFLTKIFHPTVAAQTGQLNNAAYNDQLQSESQARVWKTKMFDNSPELKNEFGDNWRGAYVKYGNLPAVNPLYTNPIAAATKEKDLGLPVLQGQNAYEKERNSYRNTIAEGIFGNPEAQAKAANSGYRLTDERNISGIANESKRAYSESLGLQDSINRFTDIVPFERELEKLRTKGDIAAFPAEQDTRLNRGTIAKATSGEEVSDLPYALNAAKNRSILDSVSSKYGGIKPIGGFSVNDNKTVHYGSNPGAITPQMMQYQNLLANPYAFSGDSSGVSGVKLPDGSRLPMKETKIDPISGNPITQNDQPKKAMDSVTTTPSLARMSMPIDVDSTVTPITGGMTTAPTAPWDDKVFKRQSLENMLRDHASGKKKLSPSEYNRIYRELVELN